MYEERENWIRSEERQWVCQREWRWRKGKRDKGKKGAKWQGWRTRSALSSSLQFFTPSPSHPVFFLPPLLLLSNLIFITVESLKQFTWSAGDMKIDSCDPPFLPGKQKWRGRRYVRARAIWNVCVCGKRCGGVNHAWAVGEEEEGGGWERCQTKRTREGESGSSRDGATRGRQRGGWVGALLGGGNLSNWFSLSARTPSCLSTWQTDSVRFSLMY